MIYMKQQSKWKLNIMIKKALTVVVSKDKPKKMKEQCHILKYEHKYLQTGLLFTHKKEITKISPNWIDFT